MLIQFADVADEQWGICHNTQIQIQIHKYKFTNTIHKYKLKLLIFVRPISCLSVTTTHYLSNYSLHKSTQLCITATGAGVTSQHIYIKHLLPTSTSSSDKVFPSCCFHNATRVTDNGSYLVAVSWVSPQLISLGWIDVDVTKRACDMISHICCSMHQDIHKLLENLSGQSTILVW